MITRSSLVNWPPIAVDQNIEGKKWGCWTTCCQLLHQLFKCCRSNFRREVTFCYQHIKLSYILLSIAIFYTCMFPLRRVAHYNHQTLVDYWPEEYTVPHGLTFVEVVDPDGIIDNIPFDEFMSRVAPEHGLEISKISIKRDDFVKSCKGCIEEPLRLRDWGHQITPDWSKTKRVIWSEWCQAVIIIVSIAIGLSPMCMKYPGVNFASMAIRACRIGLFLHLARPLFHTMTQLPGPAMHCQSPVISRGGLDPMSQESASSPYLLPSDDSFFSLIMELIMADNRKPCGDLIFSGHMINATLFLCLGGLYPNMLFGPKLQLSVRVFTIVMFCAQIFLILCSRNHYMVDIIASIVIVGLVYWIDVCLFPREFVDAGSNIESKSDLCSHC